MNNYLDMGEDNPYCLHGSANPNITGHRSLVNRRFVAPPENGLPEGQQPPTAEAAEDAAKAFTAAPDTERPTVATNRAELAARKEERDEAKAEQDVKTTESFIEQLEILLEDFVYDYDINNNLTGQERMKLIGAGVRNFGFIEKAYDMARENPQFLPKDFRKKTYKLTA
jgi:hypothetical protein